MKLSDDRIRSSIRFSLGRFSTAEDIERAGEIVPRVIDKLRTINAPHAGVSWMR